MKKGGIQLKETNMNINIDFFQKDLIQAIGVGIYEISVYKNDASRVLYIGESVFVFSKMCITFV